MKVLEIKSLYRLMRTERPLEFIIHRSNIQEKLFSMIIFAIKVFTHRILSSSTLFIQS